MNRIDLLRETFSELSMADIELLNQAARVVSFSVGDNLCVEGEVGTSLFILGEGLVEVIVETADLQEILVDSNIGPGNYFGEMALLGETTRSATVRAQTDTVALEISYEDFMPIAQANPSFLRNALRTIVGHVRRNDRAVIQELNAKNEQLQKTYSELAEQEQLRTEFIATLSHELRTPLTAIQGFLALINQGAIQGSSLSAAMSSITRNVTHMVGLTNDLLILYEMHPGTPAYSQMDTAAMVVEALNVVRETIKNTTGQEEKTAVSLNIAPDLPPVWADKRRIMLAVRALIDNAFKYDPDKKPIDIAVYQPDDASIAIAISDGGIGIPFKEQEAIFEPFHRLETAGSRYLFPGLGIGLTIARFIVSRHNGQILVESTPKQGSTFTITLPVSPSS